MDLTSRTTSNKYFKKIKKFLEFIKVYYKGIPFVVGLSFSIKIHTADSDYYVGQVMLEISKDIQLCLQTYFHNLHTITDIFSNIFFDNDLRYFCLHLA